MIRLMVSVEGPTEERFVKEVLAPHLKDKNVCAIPICIRTNGGKGGDVEFDRVVKELKTLYHARHSSDDVVTTLYDYYGFRHRPGTSVVELEEAIHGEVATLIGKPFRSEKLMPYVQLHEFEGLLFSRVECFEVLPDVDKKHISKLRAIRRKFSTPEDINDNVSSAPSKRIKRIISSYDKVIFGTAVFSQIELQTVRSQCPRFNSWISKLEALAGSA